MESGSKEVESIKELAKANEALKVKNRKLKEQLASQKLEVEKLKITDIQYKNLLEKSEAFVIINNEFKIEKFGPGVAEMNNRISLGKNFFNFFEIKEEKKFLENYIKVIQGKSNHEKYQVKRRGKDSVGIFSLTMEPYKPGFLVSIFLEEKKPNFSFDANKLLQLATVTKNGVIITDQTGKIEWVNEGYIKITGYSFDECIGIKPFYLSENVNAEGFDKRVIQEINSKQKFFGETISHKKDGSTYWLNLDINPIFNAENEITNFAIIETDISDKKETEEKLLHAANRSINILESITDAMFIINSEWQFTYLNKQAEILLNRKKEDLLGKNIWEELTFAGSGKIKDKIQEAIENQIDIHFEEYIDPAQQWFEFNGYFSKEGLSVYLKSIQSRKASEEKLKIKNEELIKINNELDSFVYRAAHDLRAPLTSVLGLINISKIEKDQVKKNDYLDKMDECINKLDSFIKKIIHYSRNSRLVVFSEKIDFENMFNDIFKHLQFFKGYEKIKFETELNVEIPFYSDKARVLDALQNLLVNAVQYQKTYIDEPFIKISVKTDYQKVLIVIEDNGNGIHEDHVDKVFQMFYRASEQSTGSGLGLYIVKEVIKKLGGTIKVSSQLKEGSIFTIEIPNGK